MLTNDYKKRLRFTKGFGYSIQAYSSIKAKWIHSCFVRSTKQLNELIFLTDVEKAKLTKCLDDNWLTNKQKLMV